MHPIHTLIEEIAENFDESPNYLVSLMQALPPEAIERLTDPQREVLARALLTHLNARAERRLLKKIAASAGIEFERVEAYLSSDDPEGFVAELMRSIGSGQVE